MDEKKPSLADPFRPNTERIRRMYAFGEGSNLNTNLAYGEHEERARFDAWLTEHDRVVAANARDEALNALADNMWDGDGMTAPNPYRITEEN